MVDSQTLSEYRNTESTHAAALNRLFQQQDDETGVFLNAAHPEVLQHLRALQRPIILDKDMVLIDEKDQAIPGARELVNGLRTIGNVIIMTTGSGRTAIMENLKTEGLWHDDMVLMDLPTFEFMNTGSDFVIRQNHGKKEEIIQEWCRNEELSEPQTVELKRQIPAYKRAAPLFNQPQDIIMIDDSPQAVTHNPGIHGIRVHRQRHDRMPDNPALITVNTDSNCATVSVDRDDPSHCSQQYPKIIEYVRNFYTSPQGGA